MHDEDIRAGGDHTDRREIALGVVRQFFVKTGVHRMRAGECDQRIAVGWRFGHDIGADDATGTGPVLDDEWLAECLCELLTGDTGDAINRATRRVTDDKAHRFVWVRLRLCLAAKGKVKSNGSGGQCGKTAARHPCRAGGFCRPAARCDAYCRFGRPHVALSVWAVPDQSPALPENATPDCRRQPAR